MKVKLNYFLIPLIVILVSAIGNIFTTQGLGGWYQTLELPSWTPAGSVIGAVWTVIFFLIAVSVLVFWNRGKRNRMFWAVVAIFLVNAFLNVFWSYLFFSKNLLFWAFIDTILLEISILALIIMLRPFSVTASALLWPYAGWVAFASYLNYSIWQLNLLA